MSKELEEIYKDYENRLYEVYAALSNYLISLKNLINTIIIMCCGICCFITILHIKFKKFTNVLLFIDSISIIISILLLVLFKIIKMRNIQRVYTVSKEVAIMNVMSISTTDYHTDEVRNFVKKCTELCDKLVDCIRCNKEINKMGVN